MTEERPSDEELIRQFQDGDVSAYEELVERYRRPLLNFIYRILNDWTFAEDLLQETYLRLYVNKDSYREIAKFSTWIYTIAGNLAKSELRRQKIRRWLSISPREDEHRQLDIPDAAANPAENVQSSNSLGRIDEEIRKLPRVFREVVILRDVQELSYEEISLILKIPLGTVKSRVNRGRRRLKEQLQDLV